MSFSVMHAPLSFMSKSHENNIATIVDAIGWQPLFKEFKDVFHNELPPDIPLDHALPHGMLSP